MAKSVKLETCAEISDKELKLESKTVVQETNIKEKSDITELNVDLGCGSSSSHVLKPCHDHFEDRNIEFKRDVMIINHDTSADPFMFSTIDHAWQEKKANYLDLPLQIKHIEQNVTELGQPVQCKDVIPDGNCFFRCISFCITGSEVHFNSVRALIVSYMPEIRQHLEAKLLPDITQTVEQYIANSRMDCNGTWATQVEIYVACKLLNTDIYTYALHGDSWKWLRFRVQDVDKHSLPEEQNIYLRNTNSNHFEVVTNVVHKPLSKELNNDLLTKYFAFQEKQNTNVKINEMKTGVTDDIAKRMYRREYMRKLRKDEMYKAKENKKKQEKRKDPNVKENEKLKKQEKRKDPKVKEKEKLKMQEKRKDSNMKENEKLKKQEKRKDPNMKENEKLKKQEKRKDPKVKENEKLKMQEKRKDPNMKENEKLKKQEKRKDPNMKENEKHQKQEKRKDPKIKEDEKLKMQEKRKDPNMKENEKLKKQEKRRDPNMKEIEKLQKQEKRKDPKIKEDEKLKMQEKRKDPNMKENEKLKKQEKRRDPNMKEIEKLQKQEKRKDPKIKEDEKLKMQQKRKDPNMKQNEKLKKQEKRKDPNMRENEKLKKQIKRKDPKVKENERISKNNKRKLSDYREFERNAKRIKRSCKTYTETERIKQHLKRRNEAYKNTERQHDCLRKHKKRAETDYFSKEKQMREKRNQGNSLEECIAKFHASIAMGPLYICSSCTQSWFRCSVSVVDRSNYEGSISEKCLVSYVSVDEKEWICNTCHNDMKKGKIPRLSLANGLGFPVKPPELYLHNLEERLVALRIPFMQIRELPRGGQIAIKGQVINVPVDIQPIIATLPRLFSDSGTIAVKLKKKLAYKSSAFYENIRPNKVVKALQWLLSNSDLYKEAGITIDPSWEQTINDDHSPETIAFVNNPGSKHCTNEEMALDDNNGNDVKSGDDEDAGMQNFLEADEQEVACGNMDTLLDNADANSDSVFVVAPGEGQTPLSIFQDKNAEYLAFPTIFCGQTRTANDNRERPIHYSDICKAELRSVDRRCALSVPNMFFKLKKLQMKQISDRVNVSLKRCKLKDMTLTVNDVLNEENVKKLVRLDEGYRIFRTLRNSPPYLESRKKDLFAMIRQLGLPTWFMSLSAADTKWIDLLSCLGKLVEGKTFCEEDLRTMDWQTKTKLLRSDPVTCARYFDHRVRLFINNIIKSGHNPLGEMTDYFYRVEFQQRGSPHIHMLMWTKNSPVFERDSEQEICSYVDQFTSCSKRQDVSLQDLITLQTHKHSKTCKKGNKPVCRFGYPMPPLPKTMILRPLDEDFDKEKYKEMYKNIKEHLDEMKEGRETTFTEFLEDLDISEDDYLLAIRSTLERSKVFLERNPSEIRVNPYMKQLIKAWQGNHDIQFVLDAYACAMYIVSYINKSQKGMSSLLERACKEAKSGNMDIRKQVRHIGNQFLNNVEVSAQEAAYLTLQLNLTDSSRSVQFINTSSPEERTFCLKDKDDLEKLNPNSTNIEKENWISKYAKRPKVFERWCLADFVSQINIKYPDRKVRKCDDDVNEDDEENSVDLSIDDGHSSITLQNGISFERRKTNRVIRFVNFNKVIDSEQHFREKLLLYLPWRDEKKDLKNSFETFEDHYNSKRLFIVAKQKQYEFNAELLQQAENAAHLEYSDEYDEIAPDAQQQQCDDELEGSSVSEKFVFFDPGAVISHSSYDIGTDIGAPPSTVDTEILQNRLSDNDYYSLLRSLNIKQKEFFSHVLHWVKTEEEKLHVMLSGGAGVGKSVVIRALHEALQRYYCSKAGENPNDVRVVLCAPTGKAAYNIGGKTIHAAFRIPANQSIKPTRLDSEQLNTFQMMYRNLSVVIIDEVSMVGCRLFNVINDRLKQFKGNTELFGGVHMILVGDLFQLKPVLDAWIFNNLPNDYGPLATNLFRDNFTMHELTEIMRQKEDKRFAQLLNRLREGCQTTEDLDLLKSRVHNHENDCPNDASRLYPCNYQVDAYNDQIYEGAKTEKVVIHALDCIMGEVPNKTKEWLIEALKDSKRFNSSVTAGLLCTLPIAVEHQYDLTINIDTEDGLTNGATCFVQAIDYRQENTSKKRPSIVWVKFTDSNIGQITRGKYHQLYEENIDPSWTPVFDTKRTFSHRPKKGKSVTVTRIQFPLKPSAAKTIHKTQGATLDTVVIDMGNKGRIPSQMHYVAMSRVTRISGLHIINLVEDKIAQDNAVKEEMQRLRNESKLDLCFSPLYALPNTHFKAIFQNARSLHLHLKDVTHDFNFLSADVIGIAESRLMKQDADEQYAIPGFQLLRNDECITNNQRPYHGLVLYVKDGCDIIQTVNVSLGNFECIFTIIKSGNLVLQIASVYSRPATKYDMLCSLLRKHVIPLVDKLKPFIIMGDFNIDVSDEMSPFPKFMSQNLVCSQIVKLPTTDHNSTIDLIFTNQDTENGVIETPWSDHKAVWAALKE